MNRITDGVLKSWEADSGHNIAVLPSTHKGWITQLVFWLVNSIVDNRLQIVTCDYLLCHHS